MPPSLEQLRAARLHLQRHRPSLEALVRDSVGLHSTDYGTPYLSAWARLPGFDARPISHDLNADHGAFLLRLLAYNADILFQIEQERQATEAKRQVLRLGLIARQRRFYNTAGRLLRAANAWILRVACNLQVEQLFAFYASELTLRT